MGLDLRLSGLASGFDWKPVVEQLIELERIPQKKLVQEKEVNDSKISELGILKSQLETLKSASEALQNEDIYDARKVVLGDGTEDYLTATAAVGTLAGEYKVSIYSLGTNTILTSDTLKSSGVGNALDIGLALKDIPLQTAITPGTFTVESQTYEITSNDLVNVSLGGLLNSIGADPEGDGYPVTFEYDSVEDRVIVDGGELNVKRPKQLPILGHPNDTSNFLKVMRLLDGEVVTRLADKDIVRDFDAADPGIGVAGKTEVWLRYGDSNLSANPSGQFGLPDWRNFAFYGDRAYQRLDDGSEEFDPDNNRLNYATGEVVYKDGVVYECTQTLPTEVYDPTAGAGDYYASRFDGGETIQLTFDSNGNSKVDQVWELKHHPKDHVNSASMGSSSDHAWNPATDAELFKKGDVVHHSVAGAKYFFQARKDSVITATIAPYENGKLYGAGDVVESVGGSDSFYERASGWNSVSVEPAHAKAGSTQYAGGDLRIVLSDQVYEAVGATGWDALAAYDPLNTYQEGDFIWDTVGGVLGAHTPTFNLLANPPPKAPIVANEFVHDGNDYFEPNQAMPQWSAANAPYGTGNVVFNAGEFWLVTAASPTSEEPTGGATDWFKVTADVTNLNPLYWTKVTPQVNALDPTYWRSAKFTDTELWTPHNTAVSESAFWTQITHITGIGGGEYDAVTWDLLGPGTAGEESPGVPFWEEVAFLGPDAGVDGFFGTGDDFPLGDPPGTTTDTNFWKQVAIDAPSPSGPNAYWQEVSESYVRSSQALGAVDISATINNANLGTVASTGSFFIGHGKGAVEITYDVNVDTITDLIERVNASAAKVTMSYDAIGDQFIIQSDLTGNLGITLNESPTWDTVNIGSGDLLEKMGLAAPQAITTTYSDTNSYQKGDYVTHTIGVPTYWQAKGNIPAGSGTTPGSHKQWEQVTLGVGRAQSENLGENAIITINDGAKIFSQSNVFDEEAHGVAGLTINTSTVTTEGASFVVERDNAPAKSTIDKFIEEFNDAQKYVSSLVAVTREGDDVTVGRFSGNLEISRLGSQLRRIVFGSNYPHSASYATDDGTNKTVADYAARDTLSTNFDADNDGYKVYVTDINPDTDTKFHYQEWNSAGGWADFTPTFSAFRINNLGLDFRSGNDEMYVKDSALLTQELTDNPNKVKALFSEEKPAAAVLDHNTNADREYGGLTYFLSEFIESFAENDTGTYKTHVESLQGQNERLDEDIDDLERYLGQREETLSRSFIRMEEMQSRMNSQLQLLQSSFNKK